MAKLLLGKPVADAIYERIAGVDLNPCLLLIRATNDSGSISYEKMIIKKAKENNIEIKQLHFAESVNSEIFSQELKRAADDEQVDAILVFKPLPREVRPYILDDCMPADKDIDCVADKNAARIYVDAAHKFSPATAQSVLEILDFYDIGVEGKNVVIVGRSKVVGKPLSSMMLDKNATVTVAHSKTKNLSSITKSADIVVLATGKANAFGKDFFSRGQVVIDVGTNIGKDGKLTGDVDFEEVEPIVEAITPVPGGVGSVTTSILLRSVFKAKESLEWI